MSQTVLILGSNGKIGAHAADAFWDAGWTVRRFNRKTDDMTKVAMGCDVIVNGLNPPMYHDWKNTIPAITGQVIEAAKASGATVILPGNIYNFGVHPGALSEATPQFPGTLKGKIRVEMEQAYRAAGIQTIILRAGSFIDPNGNGDIFSALLLREAKARKISNPGDANVKQAYCYVPDWGRAAVELAEIRDTLATFEDIPFPGHTFTLTELRTRLEAISGDRFRMTSFPWWAVTLVSPFVEVARELREMRYQYSMNHWLASEKFERLLPDFVATPLDTVISAGLPVQVDPNQAMRSRTGAIAAE